MRQLGDLLVWFAMVGVLIAVVYFTPKFAEYMSRENQFPQAARFDRGLALHVTPSQEQAE